MLELWNGRDFASERSLQMQRSPSRQHGLVRISERNSFPKSSKNLTKISAIDNSNSKIQTLSHESMMSCISINFSHHSCQKENIKTTSTYASTCSTIRQHPFHLSLFLRGITQYANLKHRCQASHIGRGKITRLILRGQGSVPLSANTESSLPEIQLLGNEIRKSKTFPRLLLNPDCRYV